MENNIELLQRARLIIISLMTPNNDIKGVRNEANEFLRQTKIIIPDNVALLDEVAALTKEKDELKKTMKIF